MLTQLLAIPSIQSVVSAQLLGTMPVGVPMLHYHATSDEIVPSAQDQALNTSYCAFGDTGAVAAVSGRAPRGVRRGDAGGTRVDRRRFAGQPAPDNCAPISGLTTNY